MNIYQELNNCNSCQLRQGCTAPVGGYGNPNSPIWFIAEAPGGNEDKLRVPLVGASGQLLDRLLWKLNITRDCVFTSNIVKCRPTKLNKKNNIVNGTPSPEISAFCSNLWLKRELKIYKPKVIIALGRVPMEFFGNSEMKISKQRGKIIKYQDISVIPTFHPSYLLRQHSEIEENKVLEDIKLGISLLDKNTILSSGEFKYIKDRIK